MEMIAKAPEQLDITSRNPDQKNYTGWWTHLVRQCVFAAKLLRS